MKNVGEGIGMIVSFIVFVPLIILVTGGYKTVLIIIAILAVLIGGPIVYAMISVYNEDVRAKEEMKKYQTVEDRQLEFELNHLKELVKECSITKETAKQRKKI